MISFSEKVFAVCKKIESKKIAMVIVGLVTLGIGAGIVFFALSYQQVRNVYFLIDVSENSQGEWANVLPQIRSWIRDTPLNTRIGLAVFGTGSGNESSCNDAVQLLPLSYKNDSVQEISRLLDSVGNLRHQSHSGLQNALIYAVSHLPQQQDKQQIIVIISRLDPLCDKLDKAKIVSLANARGIQIDIVILAIGTPPQEDVLAMRSFADHYNQVEVQQLPPSIQKVVVDFPGVYGYYPRFYYPTR